jgi:multiple sugar transport system substrate-binding protein
VHLLNNGVRHPRLTARSAALVLLSALLAGCNATTVTVSPSLPSPSGSGSGTIVWLANPTAQNVANGSRQVLVDDFEHAYPSITVELNPGATNTDSMRQQVESALSTREAAPDVYDGDVTWPYEFASKGYALPLSDYLPKSFWTDTFGTAGGGATMVRAMTVNGKIYGVPEFIDEGLLYYRADLLREAGIAGPPKTWQQLVVDAKLLKAHHLHYQFAWQGDNYEGLTCDWYEFMADALGGLPGGGSVATLPAMLTSRRSVSALEFLRSLITQGISPTNVDTYQEPTGDEAFDSGQVAFMRGWDSSYASATTLTQSLKPDQVGVEAPPTFAGEKGPGWSALGGWSVFINPHTKNLAAALTFVKWMASPAAQWVLATQYSEIPANVSVRDDPRARALNPVLDVAPDTKVVSRPANEANYALISQAIHDCVYAALPGVGTPGIAPATWLARAARALGPPVAANPPCTGPAGGSG